MLCFLEIFVMARKFSMGSLGVKFWSRDFLGLRFLPLFDYPCDLKSGDSNDSNITGMGFALSWDLFYFVFFVAAAEFPLGFGPC